MANQSVVFQVDMDRAFVPFASSFLPTFTGVLSVGAEAIRFDVQSQRSQATTIGKLGDFSILLSPKLQERYGTQAVMLLHTQQTVQPLFVRSY